MQHLRGEATGRVLGLDRDDIGHERASLATRRVVARDERYGRAEVPGEVRVERGLADGLPVQAALEDRATGIRVIEHGLWVPGATVIADEEAGVVAAVDPLPHAPRLRGADDELGARVEVVREDVVHRAVRIVDADAACAGARRAIDAG